MFKFIAKLFSADTTAALSNKARLTLTAMEDRYAPASLLNPGTTVGVPAIPPSSERAIIAINPATAKSIIVEGGRTVDTRAIIVEGG